MWFITNPEGHMLSVGSGSRSQLLENVKEKLILSSEVGEMSESSWLVEAIVANVCVDKCIVQHASLMFAEHTCKQFVPRGCHRSAANLCSTNTRSSRSDDNNSITTDYPAVNARSNLGNNDTTNTVSITKVTKESPPNYWWQNETKHIRPGTLHHIFLHITKINIV